MHQLAEVETKSGRHAQASEIYRKLVKGDPGSEVYQRGLVTSLQTAGKPDQAWSAWKLAKNAVPMTLGFLHDGQETLGALERYKERVELAEIGEAVAPPAGGEGARRRLQSSCVRAWSSS